MFFYFIVCCWKDPDLYKKITDPAPHPGGQKTPLKNLFITEGTVKHYIHGSYKKFKQEENAPIWRVDV